MLPLQHSKQPETSRVSSESLQVTADRCDGQHIEAPLENLSGRMSSGLFLALGAEAVACLCIPQL